MSIIYKCTWNKWFTITNN